MICVTVEAGTGYLVQAIGESPPDCSEFVTLAVTELNRMTYWADLAIELDPSGDAFFPLVTAMLTAFGSVLGVRFVWRYLRTLNREA